MQGTVEKMIYTLKDGSELPVAVKKTYLNQQRARRMEVYKRELRALHRISHPNVVKLLGMGVDPCDEFIYLVIELCDCSGWEYVERVFSKASEFPKDILIAWAELAEGCDEMAKKGILHRDLTLDNILVTQTPSLTLKICDFGVSGTAEDFSEIPRGKMRNYPPEAMGPKNLHECYE